MGKDNRIAVRMTDKEKQTLRGESVPQKNYER